MKKELLISLILGILIMSANAVAPQKNVLNGSWKCVANDVPEEYKNSTITISEKDGKLAGTVKFDNSTEIALNYVNQNGNDVVMSIYVDGNEIIIKSKLEGSKMTGTADTPNGVVTLSATKVEKKK